MKYVDKHGYATGKVQSDSPKQPHETLFPQKCLKP